MKLGENTMIDFWLHHKIWNAIKIESKWLGNKTQKSKDSFVASLCVVCEQEKQTSAICCFPSSLKQTPERTHLGNHL